MIAGDGTVLEPYVVRRYAGLPLVVGAGADNPRQGLSRHARPPSRTARQCARQRAGRRAALEPAAQERRRCPLPEFDVGHALDQFAALERDGKLSGRDIVAIDCRLPDRVTVRLSEAAAAEKRDEAQKKKSAEKPKGGNA